MLNNRKKTVQSGHLYLDTLTIPTALALNTMPPVYGNLVFAYI